MSKRGLPWMMFYPADWLSDAVAGCSPAAKGIWIDMLCVMHGSQRYGYLESEGKPIPDELMFRRCGCANVEEYRNLLAELFAAGVPSRAEAGVIYSRRMARDQQDRNSAAERQRRHRASNASVTPVSQVEVRSHKSEVRVKKDTTEPSAPVRVPAEKPLELETKEAAFGVFWEAWPEKQAKAPAFRAWLKVAMEEYGPIMAGLEKWKSSAQWKRKVIPHPATWLNDKRWQDEDIPQEGGANGKPSATDLALRNARTLGLTGKPVN
jgi:hypothetical protein